MVNMDNKRITAIRTALKALGAGRKGDKVSVENNRDARSKYKSDLEELSAPKPYKLERRAEIDEQNRELSELNKELCEMGIIQ